MRLGCVVPVLSGEYCDFCTAGKVFKLYRCTNFVVNNMPVFPNGSGTWAACKTCAELVDADRWPELVQALIIDSFHFQNDANIARFGDERVLVPKAEEVNVVVQRTCF